MIKRSLFTGVVMAAAMTVGVYGYSPEVYMTTAPLNLRPTPCTSLDRIKLVQPGQRVEVVDFLDGEWFRVNYNGTLGYMYAEFLMQPTTVSTAAISAGAIELAQWSEMRNVLPQGVPFTVVDVRTGIRYQMISFSHGSHADVFPATPEDTEIFQQTFGGSWTWTPRPILVMVGDRTIAASINGMPHGSSVPSRANNMAGHVCIHFQGSLTHNRSVNHERDHQNAVVEAFNTASTW